MPTTTNPLVDQGVLNRVRGTLQVNDFPNLNITASFLAREGMTLRRVTNVTDIIDTMTGFVVSPAPYQRIEVMVHMLRTQSLAAQWEAQLQLQSNIGGVVVRLDVTAGVHPPYQLSNCCIMNVDPYRIDGLDPGYVLNLVGILYVNASVWS